MEFIEFGMMTEWKFALSHLVDKFLDLHMVIESSIWWENVFFFNIKAYYWIEKANLVLELVFNPTKKGFFSMGKQEQPVDYF